MKITMADPGDLTILLRRVSAGDLSAEAELMERVYAELKSLAARFMREERPDHTLQATALVHEAFVKLSARHNVNFVDRTHFFAVAAQIMRRLLIDHGRKHRSQKRGGGKPLPLDDLVIKVGELATDIEDLHLALERLEKAAPRQAKVVEMRYFGGMSEDEIAAHLNISPRTVKRDWVLARARLYAELTGKTLRRVAT
jgi:RNA polymerase sigma-70 factor, ECF subfamily